MFGLHHSAAIYLYNNEHKMLLIDYSSYLFIVLNIVLKLSKHLIFLDVLRKKLLRSL